jgi:hypothetical protein
MSGADVQDEIEKHREQRSALPPTPRWVKISGAIALVVVLLLLLVLLLGGEHGPGRHGGGTTVVLAMP